MKTIGLIGGTSWQSTLDYYRYINSLTEERIKGHSAKILLYSLDFAEVMECVKYNKMDELARLLTEAAAKLAVAGASCLLLCANTLHMFAPQLKKNLNIPLIHIVEETLKSVMAQGFSKVGLLGTKPTMEMDFYKDIFSAQKVEVMIPGEHDRNFIHQTIFDELFAGNLLDASRNRMLKIIDKLAQQGAQGIILGCTEIPLIVDQRYTTIPLFDSVKIHALAAVDYSLKIKTE